MSSTLSLADPFWVNTCLIVPILLWLYWKKHKLVLSVGQLVLTAVFGIAFSFIEGACVIYLRAASGLLPGFEGTLSEIQKQSTYNYSQTLLKQSLPMGLLTIEVVREFGTLIMLVAIVLIAVKSRRERLALFFWTAAFWDFFYYISLYATIRWPYNLTTVDVLFLIPQPWIGQVWLPMLADILIFIAVMGSRAPKATRL